MVDDGLYTLLKKAVELVLVEKNYNDKTVHSTISFLALFVHSQSFRLCENGAPGTSVPGSVITIRKSQTSRNHELNAARLLTNSVDRISR